MSSLTDYVNAIVEQAYHDGAAGARDYTQITYLTEEDAERFIARELETGAWDEWIAEYVEALTDDQPTPAGQIKLGSPVQVMAFRSDTSVREGLVTSYAPSQGNCWYVTLGSKGGWYAPSELEIL